MAEEIDKGGYRFVPNGDGSCGVALHCDVCGLPMRCLTPTLSIKDSRWECADCRRVGGPIGTAMQSMDA